MLKHIGIETFSDSVGFEENEKKENLKKTLMTVDKEVLVPYVPVANCDKKWKGIVVVPRTCSAYSNAASCQQMAYFPDSRWIVTAYCCLHC